MAGLAAAVATRTAVQEPAASAAVAAPAAQGTDVSNLTTVTSWANVKAAGAQMYPSVNLMGRTGGKVGGDGSGVGGVIVR